ncbi:flagellar assembly protein FliW [Inconstantimicrobium mannanitabidum]|uniref:Flagellar assembly factor FliW n=1 Tax=Inconstantimicrobium mannanitabidum TaxID=1604901 RepID=A0ACB5R919_9CLOT|nr:flagellar assembly protein FliW [Clostridium sp. TW13]GKX65461.1 flagellar assembly factor FliW [Clostridium sp. TW13]
MKFNTAYNGEINYEEKDIITIKKGIPGFKGLTKFVILDVEDNDVFKLIHSLEDPSLGLIILSPFSVVEDYEIKLSEEVIAELQIEKEQDVVLYSIVTLNSDSSKITANLMAPIVINVEKKLGQQVIIENSKYKIKEPIIQG